MVLPDDPQLHNIEEYTEPKGRKVSEFYNSDHVKKHLTGKVYDYLLQKGARKIRVIDHHQLLNVHVSFVADQETAYILGQAICNKYGVDVSYGSINESQYQRRVSYTLSKSRHLTRRWTKRAAQNQFKLF